MALKTKSTTISLAELNEINEKVNDLALENLNGHIIYLNDVIKFLRKEISSKNIIIK